MFGRKGVSISRRCLWYKLAFLEKVKEKALRGNCELINKKWFINSEELWVKFGHLCILFLYLNNVDLLLLNTSLRSNSESSCLLVVGGFNIPALDWTDSSSPVNIRGSATGDNFCDLMGGNFLVQFVDGPIHIAGNNLILFCAIVLT